MSARTLALRILGGFALLLVALVLLFSRTDKTADTVTENRARIASNRDAILTSCNLLRDLFIRAGGSDARESNAPPNEAAQLLELRISVLRRLMTRAERREERRLLSYLASHGGLVTAPNCERIAGP